MNKLLNRLLSEVLGEEYSLNEFPDGYSINYKTTLVLSKYSGVEFINIYELAHKCKEWAYERDFYIYSIFTFAGEGACYVTKDDEIQKRLATFAGDSEPEAIFKACQWILDNKDKQ